ncbi:MAG: hypothetical protein AB1774_05535 [Bacillota bacterium]
MLPHSLSPGSPDKLSFGSGRARRVAWRAVLLSILLSCIFCSALQAEISMSLTPLLVELTAGPGDTKTFDVLLVNESKTASAHFRVFTADVAEKQNGDYCVVESGESKYSCARWIKLSANEADLGPGEGLALTGKLTVPRGVFGGRYAAVVFELAPEKRTGEAFASTEFVQRFVTVVEVSIPAPRVRKILSVEAFTVKAGRDNPRYASAFGEDALILVAQVKNEGNTHIFARGFLTLRDGSGRRLRQIPLGSGRGLVLPETSVNLVSVLPAGLAPGDYIADIAVKYGGMRPALAKVPFTVGAGGAAARGVEGEARLAPFSVEPADMGLTYPPGAVAARSVVIENRSDVPIHVEGRAVPLVYDEEGELVQDVGLPDEWSCAGWVELRPASLDIRPKGRQVVRVMIDIPKDQAGGRYANLVFTATPGAAGAPAWTGEAGTVVFLTVGKQVEKRAQLTELKAEDSGPSVGWVFSTTFKNTGTTHVRPQVAFAVKKHVMPPESVPGIEYVGPGSWVEVDSVDLGELENVVLPGGTRLLRAGYARPLEPGEYMVEVTVKYGGKSPLYASKEFTVKQP